MLFPGGQSRKPRCVLRLPWHLIHVNISTKVNIKTAALPSLDLHTVHATISSHLDVQPLPKGSPTPAALQSNSHSSDLCKCKSDRVTVCTSLTSKCFSGFPVKQGHAENTSTWPSCRPFVVWPLQTCHVSPILTPLSSRPAGPSRPKSILPCCVIPTPLPRSPQLTCTFTLISGMTSFVSVFTGSSIGAQSVHFCALIS